MIPTDCDNIHVIKHLEQPRECLEKAIQRVHEEMLRISQNEITKKFQ